MSTAAATPADPTRHFAFWPKRQPRELDTPDTSLWANLDITHRRYADRPAFVFFDRVISYRELFASVEKLAGWLQQVAGVKKGDRVALCLQNSPQFVIAYYAVLRADAVVVPVNPMNKAAELTHYITDPVARVAIVGSDLAAAWIAANQEVAATKPDMALQHLLVTRYCDEMSNGALPAGGFPDAWRAWLDLAVDMPTYATAWRDAMGAGLTASAPIAGPDDLAVLPYTSGTTGLPKGCMHTHRTLMHNVLAGAIWGCSTSETIGLGVVPMFHITGFIYGCLAAVAGGGTTVLLPRWDRELAGRLIARHRVTHWTCIPTMIIDLFASPHYRSFDLSSLVYLSGGGAAMPAAVAQRLQDEFGIAFAEGYGLTETAAPSHANPPERAKLQCLGIPFFSTDSRVVDPVTFEEVPPGQDGEIIVHGPQIMRGYWGQPKATEQAFVEIGPNFGLPDPIIARWKDLIG